MGTLAMWDHTDHVEQGRLIRAFGAQGMALVWRRMSLIGGVGQAVGGYVFVTLFAFAESHTPLFLVGGAAMALGGFISLRLGAPGGARRRA